MVERLAVNQDVIGSNPIPGANLRISLTLVEFFVFGD